MMKINRIRRASYQMIYDCRVDSFVIQPGLRLGGALISHTLIDHTWHAQSESFERGNFSRNCGLRMTAPVD